MSGPQIRWCQPPDEDGLFRVPLPCGHETLIDRPRALLGMHITGVTCGECQSGPYLVIPVSNQNLDMIGSWGPRSPSGMTFIVGPVPEGLVP